MRTSSEIQADLTEARTALRSALSAQSYSLDTGQGKQTVSRANLSEIKNYIHDLEIELDQSTASENGCGGLVAGELRRR